MRWKASAAFCLLASLGSPAMAVEPQRGVEWAAYELCPMIFSGRLKVDDTSAMASVGYKVDPADDEGMWASTTAGTYQIRIGTSSEKPGCRVRFTGPDSSEMYETILKGAIGRGYVFPSGERKPAESQFILDTVASENGPIGIISMFRVLVPGANQVAMTIFPHIEAK